MTHEEAELAIGMQQHGALDARAEASLDEHLASCAACRAFAETTRSLEAQMRMRLQDELSAIDWTRIEARMARLRAEQRYLVPGMASFGLALAGALALVFDREVAIAGVALTGVLCAIAAIGVRGRARELARAGESRGELFAVYRDQNAAALRRTRAARWYLPAFALLWLGSAGAIAVSGQPLSQISYYAGGAIAFGVWGITTWYDHGRLRREMAELA